MMGRPTIAELETILNSSAGVEILPDGNVVVKMDFGQALAALKLGSQVSRAGWNGKGMWLAYQPGYPSGIAINANTAKATRLPEGTICKFLPYIMMRTAGGEFVPWLASQADVLAEDWTILVDG